MCVCVPLSRFRRLSGGGGVVLTSLALDGCFGMVSDGFQTQKRGSWIPGKSVQKESWRVRSQLMGERRGHVNSAQSRMCTGLRGKYRQAIAAWTGEGSTGSSTSSGEEERRNKSLEAVNKELRVRLGALEKKEREGV